MESLFNNYRTNVATGFCIIKATKVDKRNKFSGNLLLEFIINHFESHPHPSAREIRRYATHLIQVTFPSPSEIKHLLTSFDIKKVLEVGKIPYKGGVLCIRYFQKSVFLDKAETKIIYVIEKKLVANVKISSIDLSVYSILSLECVK